LFSTYNSLVIAAKKCRGKVFDGARLFSAYNSLAN
jgi:hypothetical protein